MAAVVTVVISAPSGTIGQLNAKLPTSQQPDKSKLVNALIDMLSGAVGPGTIVAGSIQVTVRDTDPGISTSGTGSTQVTVSVG